MWRAAFKIKRLIDDTHPVFHLLRFLSHSRTNTVLAAVTRGSLKYGAQLSTPWLNLHSQTKHRPLMRTHTHYHRPSQFMSFSTGAGLLPLPLEHSGEFPKKTKRRNAVITGSRSEKEWPGAFAEGVIVCWVSVSLELWHLCDCWL